MYCMCQVIMNKYCLNQKQDFFKGFKWPSMFNILMLTGLFHKKREVVLLQTEIRMEDIYDIMSPQNASNYKTGPTRSNVYRAGVYIRK